MPASRNITLAVSVGDDGMVHLTGQAGPGREQRLHVHVPRESAQDDKLRRYLENDDSDGSLGARVLATRQLASAAGWRLHWNGVSYSLDTDGQPVHRDPINNLTLAQAAAVIAFTGDPA